MTPKISGWYCGVFNGDTFCFIGYCTEKIGSWVLAHWQNIQITMVTALLQIAITDVSKCGDGDGSSGGGG